MPSLPELLFLAWKLEFRQAIVELDSVVLYIMYAEHCRLLLVGSLSTPSWDYRFAHWRPSTDSNVAERLLVGLLVGSEARTNGRVIHMYRTSFLKRKEICLYCPDSCIHTYCYVGNTISMFALRSMNNNGSGCEVLGVHGGDSARWKKSKRTVTGGQVMRYCRHLLPGLDDCV